MAGFFISPVGRVEPEGLRDEIDRKAIFVITKGKDSLSANGRGGNEDLSEGVKHEGIVTCLLFCKFW